MSAYGDRQHTPKHARGKPPVAVPPIRDEKAFVEQRLEQALESFDSEVSLEMLDGSALVERASELDQFPSELEDVDDAVADDAPTNVVAPPPVVAVDQRAIVFSTDPKGVAVPPKRPAVVRTISQRAPLFTTRRMVIVAGICGCLGLTTLSILMWRTPAPAAAPSQAARDALPSTARAAPQEPIPTRLATPTPGASSTLEPTAEPDPATQPEQAEPDPEVLSEPVADSRGPIATTAPAAVALPPTKPSPAGPKRLTRGVSADTSETTAIPRSAENTRTPATRAQAELKELPALAAAPVSASDAPAVRTSAAALPPAPPMRPPLAPLSAPAVPDTGATATTPVPARDATDIEMVLTQYRSAFSVLDATAVSKVWPSVDSRALARAFRGLEEQGIAFDTCVIQVTGASAAASCGGSVRYVTKVGSKEPRTEHRRWQFTLGKVHDLWMIQTVESR